MDVCRKWGLMFLLFPLLVLCLPTRGFPEGELDGCALCLHAGNRSDFKACLEALDGKDLSVLLGNGKPAAAQPTTQNAIPEICESISDGNDNAMSIGFRLCIVLKDAAEEKIIEALGVAMLKNPNAFLIDLQSMMDFSKVKNVSGPFEEYFWNAFMETDFGYQGPLEDEWKAMQQRKEIILNLKDPAVKDAREYILEMLDEKMQALPSGI